MSKPTYQLTMPLVIDLPEGEDDEKQKSESSRLALDALFGKAGAPRWLDDYLELYKHGWDWRVAAYIAWASMPKVSREPKTQDELARIHLGLASDRAIIKWKNKNPVIEQMIFKLQASPLWKHRGEIITAMVAVAVKPDPKSHADRKMALKMMGDLDEEE